MIVLIDGRSGSGKSSLAVRIAQELDAQLVRLDDVYPGWDGLDAGSDAVPGILTSHRWQRWDWATGERAEWHELDPDRPLVIEGVGAISRASKPLADWAIWVEADDDIRKRRALRRDGDTYAPHWDRWAAQEDAFIARENPKELADEIRRVEA